MATLLDLLAIDRPVSVEGRSLLTALAGLDDREVRPVFSKIELTGNWESVVSGDLHLIRNLDTGESELFDWSRDRNEQKPLQAAAHAELVALLDARRSAEVPAEPREAEFEPSPELRDQLEALGYIHGAESSSEPSGSAD